MLDAIGSRARASLSALALSAVASLALTAVGCGGAPPADERKPPIAVPASADPDALPPPAFETGLPEDVRGLLGKTFTGDLDEIVKRRMIRVGVTFSRTFYFVDKGQQRGSSYEYGKAFEDELNRKLKTGTMKVHVVFMPLPRDLLVPSLVHGKVDVVMAQLTVTPERQKLVDFANPTRRDLSEVVVTGPGAPVIATVDDLSGQEVFARPSSSYYQSLLALNDRLKSRGRPPVVIRDASENLEDDDLLEMVNAGLIPITVVDDYLAEFWKKIFTRLTVHEGVAVRTGGALAPAIRKNSPKLAATVNEFIATFGLGTAFGNMIEKRYLASTTYVRNATAEAERRKFRSVLALFEKYGDRYRMDYLLMAAQGYQESTLDQNAKSPVGAIGIMQLMPATGREQQVGDITRLEPNIHAGVKYMRFMMDQYFKDEPMDDLNKGLFTFASYNAGPGRIRQLRKEAGTRGLNPNVWFGNVEQIASERIGRETVTYVSNIYKYYVAYRLLVEQVERRNAAKAALKPGSGK